MGSFSWLKADNLTKVANIVGGKSFKFLIPKEFGGGFIKDKYQDYGYLDTKEDGSPKYDMYEILAFWNREQFEGKKRLDPFVLKGGDDSVKMKEIDEYTNHNRGMGIDIGCSDNQINRLKYPLKLVSASFKGTYEDLENPSYGDPNQGFGELYRDEL